MRIAAEDESSIPGTLSTGSTDDEALRQILNARGEGAVPDERLPEPTPTLLRTGAGKHKRAGYTTNKGRPRNKARARMAKVSRVRNRR